MKFLIISNIFPPGFIGGYELVALAVAKGLHAIGHEIHVLTSNYFLDDQEQFFSLNISRSLICTTITHERLPSDHFRNLYYNFHNIRVLGSTIRRIKPDVVLAFNLHGLGVFSILEFLQRIRMPTILRLGDNIFFDVDLDPDSHKQYEKLFGTFQFKDTTRIIAVSKNISAEVSASLKSELRNVIHLPGWVDFDSKERFPINVRQGGKTNFIFCSRVASHKGPHILLEASALLIERGLTQFSIDVYGKGEVAAFLNQVKAKNLDAYISYKDLVPKEVILKVFSAYDALVFPTWQREPLGGVACEAAVAGCFPIMTGGIGASEWFLDGYDCLKIFRNSTSLANAMSQVMNWTDEELAIKRKISMRTGRENFSFKRSLSIIQQECLNISTKKSTGDLTRATKGFESAFLYLNSLLKESRHCSPAQT